MYITLIENFRAVFYAPFYATIALGAYEAEGLEVSLKTSADAAQTAQSLIAGQGDVSWGGPLRLMMALEKNPRGAAIAFCEAVGRDPFFLVGREPDPGFRLEHLRGRNVAIVTEVPTPWMCLQQDLLLAGMDPGTVRLAPGRSMADNAAALRGGDVDVIQVFEPYAEALVRQGAGYRWYAAARRGPVSYTTLNTTRVFAERHPDVLLRMCRAMYRTQKWIAAHDGATLAAALAAYFPDVPVATLTACFDGYKSLGLWNRTPVLQREGFDWLRDAGLASGILRQKFSYEDCVDMRYAEEALAEDPPPLEG
jgi:NitT/TauT family transport system substrate-binding protein